MKCTVCGKETDVLAEGKCVQCYEKALSGVAPVASVEPAVAAAAPRTDSSKSTIAAAVQINAATPLPAKRSWMKTSLKYGALVVFALVIGSAIAYWQLFLKPIDGDSTALGTANLTEVTQEKPAPTAEPDKDTEDTEDADAESDENAEDADAEDSDAEDEDAPADDTDETDAESDADSDTADTEDAPCDPEADGRTDTDCDGIWDDKEEKLGTNPLKADTDGDGLNDREELLVYGTDPDNDDTDGDGFGDGLEAEEGTATDNTKQPQLGPDTPEKPVDRDEDSDGTTEEGVVVEESDETSNETTDTDGTADAEEPITPKSETVSG